MRRDEFLREQKVMRLATVGGGMPHVVPVWYLYMGKKFYVGTHGGSRKAKNVAEGGRVSFCIDVGVNAPGIYGVMGQGAARLIRGAEAKRIAGRILLKYFASLEERSAKELLDDTDCIIEIVPEKMVTWSY